MNQQPQPKFNNVHNKGYNTKDGFIWNSRSCAVVCAVIASYESNDYVLLGKRGSAGDQPNKWNIPCGYIDWSENLEQAAMREIWEETGVNLQELTINNSNIFYNGLSQPWFVNSQPSENRQNIAMHVYIKIKVDALPKTSLANMEKNESVAAEWFPMIDALNLSQSDWAFNHNTRLEMLINLLSSH